MDAQKLLKIEIVSCLSEIYNDQKNVIMMR